MTAVIVTLKYGLKLIKWVEDKKRKLNNCKTDIFSIRNDKAKTWKISYAPENLPVVYVYNRVRKKEENFF